MANIELSNNTGSFADYDSLSRREWLETNGLGGWAGSSVSGANTRRYHGLLVAATVPPTQRYVLLSKLDETVVRGATRYELSSNQYPSLVAPQGYRYLRKFERDLFPVFEYVIDEIVIRKTVAAIHGENTSVVIYEVVEAASEFSLELRPMVAARDYHAMTRSNDFIQRFAKFHGGIFKVVPYQGAPELNIQVPRSSFIEKPEWYYNLEYLRELERGANYQEDLFSYGFFNRVLSKGDKLAIIVSTEETQGRDALKLLEQERERRLKLLQPLPLQDAFARGLFLAADQFIVIRGANAKTVIAGYPWFTDWGRDTMIALPGLCLSTGRFADAKEIISIFCQYVSAGMIPNCFPDGAGEPSYNTVDASLWFFIAVWEWYKKTADDAFMFQVVLPKLIEIIEHHQKGTRYNIHADKDGLLCAGDASTQLTWMDAKVGDRAITPRYGKAVEINALWYNALMISAELCQRFSGQNVELASKGKQYSDLAAKVKKQFVKVFWNEKASCLYDYVAAKDGTEYRNEDVRPNQVMALSLPHEILPQAKAKSILAVVEDKLLTPYGLRTLSPDSPEYCARYQGDGAARDSAYHQGTVWPWLYGPYVIAVKRYGSKKQMRTVLDVFDSLKKHFEEDGVQSIAEIFDASDPQRPAGCPFQAWSVAEVLRAYLEIQADASAV